MLPPHLQLTDEERKKLGDVVGATSWKSSDRTQYNFVTRESPHQNDVTLKGGWDQVAEYLYATNPDLCDGCPTVTKLLDHRKCPSLLVWCVPYYVGTSLDRLMYLLHKYNRVHVEDAALRTRVHEGFSFIRQSGKWLFLKDPEKSQRKKLDERNKRNKERRIKRGEVYHWPTSSLFYHLASTIQGATSFWRMHGYCHDRCTETYIRGIPELGRIVKLLKLEKRLDGFYLEKLYPFIPGLLKHKKAHYRKLGRWLKTNKNKWKCKRLPWRH